MTGIGAASNVEYDLDEFEHIRTLGYGRFGAVKLVRRQGHNGVYALKILFKEPLVDLNLQMSPYGERDLLQFSDHPFIPAIYATFQDQNCFYLLLEAIPGGDFWNILYDRQSWTKLESKTHLGGLPFPVSDYPHCFVSWPLPRQDCNIRLPNFTSQIFSVPSNIYTTTR